MRIKIIGYILGALFLASLSTFAYKEYVFTIDMPSTPDSSSGRTIEMTGFYGKHIFVRDSEIKLIKYLSYITYTSGGLFFLFCAKFGNRLKD